VSAEEEIEKLRKYMLSDNPHGTEIVLWITKDEANDSLTEMTDKDGRKWRRVGRHTWTARRAPCSPTK
jgi:hypothetical protein